MNRDPGKRRETSRRQQVRALSDTELLAEMRTGDPWAWGEFDARFRPLLEEYASRTAMPEWEWNECIQDVLDDEALRLTSEAVRPPDRLHAYLVQAVRHRYLAIKRARLRHERRDRDALQCQHDENGTEVVFRTLCSEHALRESDRDGDTREDISPVLARMAREIHRRATDEERQLLRWLEEKMTHRQIAAWLGVNDDAASKRLWRLCKRLRAEVWQLVGALPPGERREIDRFCAGHSRPERRSPRPSS